MSWLTTGGASGRSVVLAHPSKCPYYDPTASCRPHMPLIRRPVRLHTFGGLGLMDGTEVVASQRHRLALLALLAVAGERGCTRDKLMAYLSHLPQIAVE